MRKTRIKKELERIFSYSKKPLTVAEILILFKKSKLEPNKTTVYRQLEKMTKEKEIEHVHFEGVGLGYEKTGKHHHHLICNNCKKVEDLFIKNEENLFAKFTNKKGFKPEEHHLEIFGLCASCK